MQRNIINQDKPDFWNSHYATGKPYQDDQEGDRQIWLKFLDDVIPTGKLRILEIGCGIGDYSNYLANQGHIVTATDYSEAAIDQCRRRYPHSKAEFKVMDARKIPLERYDIIMAFEIIEHFKEFDPILYRIRKALAPSGKFIFSLPHKEGANGDLEGHYTFWNYESTVERMFRFWPVIEFHSVMMLTQRWNIFGIARRVEK